MCVCGWVGVVCVCVVWVCGCVTHLKTAHVEEEVRVILAVHRHEAVLPLDGGDRAGELVLDVPKDGATEVNVVLHQAHAPVARPAFFVVVPNHIFIVGVRVLA